MLIAFSIIFGIIMDLVLAVIALYIVGIPSVEHMRDERLYDLIAILYPQLIVTSIASWFIRNRKKHPAKKIFAILSDVERSGLSIVTSLIVIQFILLGATQVIQLTEDETNEVVNTVLIYLVILVSFLALVSMIRLLVRMREQTARTTQEVYIDEINDMFTAIRGQRHDFLNHVQVIHTMTQMNKTDQLKAYVADLVKETRDVSEIVHHSSPALAAFIQAKTTVSIGKAISFTYELPNDWDTSETAVKAIDVIKIMGNLVDNAFDEAMTLPPEERSVHASVKLLTTDEIELRVTNRGRTLNEQEKKTIFTPGYTTKGEGHSGLGLAIVLERVKHYNGTLNLRSEAGEGMTEFRITLPQSAL
ncbi:sensor histidine kinase [Paenibacillaceae bacterium WGS1546]|uniref:sensor histidine kinase n=1 Tax=Cohnella sp. WGS1546 TaxID=3366810 RepID=UPI00372D4EDD